MSQPVLIIGGFFAIPYIFYAVIQTARRRTAITGFGTLLACAAVVVPVALLAYQTVQGVSEPSLVAAAVASAGIVVLFSIVILIRDLLRKPRDLNQSYGPLGLGVALLLVAGMITTPAILGLFPDAMPVSASAANNSSGGSSAVADVLTAETGLDAQTILSQVSSGKTIAEMVSAHNGDVNKVTTALASALQEIAASRPQILQRLGGDATTAATQIIQGQAGQIADFMLRSMLSGGSSGSAGNFSRSNGNGGTAQSTQGRNFGSGNGGAAQGTPAANDGSQNGTRQSAASNNGFPNAPAGFAAPGNDQNTTPQAAAPAATSGNGFPNAPSGFAAPGGANQGQETATPEPMATNTATPRPTRATLTPTPTLTPFPTLASLQTQTAPTSEAAANTCPISTAYNLNVRSQPGTDNPIVTTIPFGSIVQAQAKTSDGWYQVTYNNQTGWVDGQYVTSTGLCSNLPTVH